MFKKYASLLGIAGMKLVSRIPFRVLYAVSDLLYLVVYHIICYRRRVILANLTYSFPDKDRSAIQKISRDYYRNLCDIIVETLKTQAMTAEELSRRMVIRNPELPDEFFEKGKSVLVLAMHYGNWEWLLHMPRHIRHHHFFVYKPLQNPWLDRYLNDIRRKYGGETASMNIILRKLIEADKAGTPVLTWLAADQTPPWNHPFWTTFMHQETQFFEGPATIAQRFDQPVLLQKTRRTQRGYYETWFEVLFENPREVSAEDIILTYVGETERIIREHPELYLWSHRRWKHARLPGQTLRRRQ